MNPHLEACICFALICFGCACVGFAFNQSQPWRTGGKDDDQGNDGEAWKRGDKTKHT